MQRSGTFSPLPGTGEGGQYRNKAGASAGFFSARGGIYRVLGIDPGLASTGFGIVDFCENRYRMVAYGCIETQPHAPHGERLLAIYARLTAVLEEFEPQAASMEDTPARSYGGFLPISKDYHIIRRNSMFHRDLYGLHFPVKIKTLLLSRTRQMEQRFSFMILWYPYRTPGS